MSYIWGTIIYSAIGMIFVDKNKKNNIMNKIPSFKGILEVRHCISGRIRIYIPILKNNEEIKSIIIEQLSKIKVITNIEINTITGTVLLNYDNEKIDPMIIIGVMIKILNLEQEIEKKPKSKVEKEMIELRTSVNRAVYEKTQGIIDGRTALGLSLFLFGIYRLRKNTNIIPSGMTLMWWVYSEFFKGGVN
ncbi:MAG: hypothetical protein N4A48_08955 [Tepidibacter sp.]|jgi:uncharacterized protein YlbG (UPF0298 family)|uniref:HMA2 domain-containing protein n=1 Tax=Tepidibacter sp. TaxID=2529387 RepID=UPI0025F24387|nr:hypothetical protein [Tepidibacter sp.]MCT4508875.1 hypothetical protein [Tepidibacter sp.]